MTTPGPLLKTQRVAVALGVSVSTVKRWVDAGALGAARTLGKHRLIPLREAVRFAREQGLPLSGLEGLLGAEAVEAASRGDINDRLCDALVTRLCRGEAREARALIHSVYAAGHSAAELADRLIRPVMEAIGHGWEVGSIDVYHEHQASRIIESAITGLIEQLTPGNSGLAWTPKALGATPEGDAYVLPLLAGEMVLRELGWEVRNLGVNLPMRAMTGAVTAYRPRLVFLSASHLEDADRFAKEYAQFYRSAVAAGSVVILGGRAFGPDLRARLPYASYGERMAHLAEFARGLAPGGPVRPDPAGRDVKDESVGETEGVDEGR